MMLREADSRGLARILHESPTTARKTFAATLVSIVLILDILPNMPVV